MKVRCEIRPRNARACVAIAPSRTFAASATRPSQLAAAGESAAQHRLPRTGDEALSEKRDDAGGLLVRAGAHRVLELREDLLLGEIGRGRADVEVPDRALRRV